jgi:hypothetical protein
VFTKVLKYTKYITHELTHFIILFYSPPSLVPRLLSTGLIFPFTYMCTHTHVYCNIIHNVDFLIHAHWMSLTVIEMLFTIAKKK